MMRKGSRPVVIASLCGARNDDAAFWRLLEEAAGQHPDLIVLPETWQASNGETLESPVIRRLCALAQEAGCSIVHPTLLEEEGVRHNTALLIDRDGKIAGRYDKMYPYWEEYPAVSPGDALRVMDCDFGKLAILICFDANFPSVWAEAARQGAELVIWPSAYGAGTQLAAHALNHHYPIVTSTLTGHCMAFDIDGSRMLNVRGDGHFTQWISLDLDRCIFHENFNEDKLSGLLAEDPPRVEIEKRLPDEQWIVVRASMADVSAREICAQAGMEELRAYKRRSQASIDEMRRCDREDAKN